MFTSGAGISCFSPRYLYSPRIYPRDNLSNSPLDNSLGSTITPPFPPPYGRLATAHLNVIQIDNAFTSSPVTCGWKRSPPFVGPIASLCCERKPLKYLTSPLSILTGIEISIKR